MRILTNVSKAELDYLTSQPTAKAMIEKNKAEAINIAKGDAKGAAAFVASHKREKQEDALEISDAGLAALKKSLKAASKVNNIGDTNRVKAKDNKIVFNDPIMDACSQYGTLISINEDGVPQWEINPGAVSKFDQAVEEGLRKIGGRDNYNFWMRLTQDPTFMGLTYSAEDIRNRLHSAGIQKGFFQVTVGEHTATQFLSEGKNTAAVYSKAYYDDQYYNYVKSGGICRDYESGDVFKIDGEEYTVNADRKLDVPYGVDIWNIEWPQK